MGTPRRAVLKRVCVPVTSHAAAEIQRAGCSFESQPRAVAGHSGDDPPDLETLRPEAARLHHILIQGHSGRSWLAPGALRDSVRAGGTVPDLLGFSHIDLTVSDCEKSAVWWQDV